MEERKFKTSLHRHSCWSPSPAWMSVLLLVNSTYAFITCGSDTESVGVTVPRGDIVIEYGSGVPLEITCVLDPDNEKVQKLFRNETTDGGEANMPSQRIVFYKNAERVSRQYTMIINSTAARMRISDPPAGRYIYYCTLLLQGPNYSYDNISSSQLSYTAQSSNSSTNANPQPKSLETSGPPSLVSPASEVGLCLTSVAVGYKPAKITNFSCISDNWVSLTCNWTKPENPIKTTYKLFFRLPGQSGGRTIKSCPNDSDSRENTCYWDLSTTPMYRQPYEYYSFTLLGDNVLGNSSTPIHFHHYANVIPASPINITVVDKTQSSAMLRWSVGTMTSFPRKLIHKIEYKSQWDSKPEHWHSVNVSYVCNSLSSSNQTISDLNCRERDIDYYYFNVTDLKYPFTHYDFRIYVRSSLSRGEDKWSPPGCITLKTKPSIPRRPPRTDIGSFECVPSLSDKSKRDVFIYWQNIEDNEKCGDSFEYRAYYTSTTIDNKTIIHHSNEIFKNYAKFEGLSTDIGYNFTVYSSNKEGLSTEYSTIFVPNESDKLNKPLLFTKIAFDEQGVFELSWKNSSSQKLLASNQVNDFTIFWCETDKESNNKYQCNGSMNWMHIPSSIKSHYYIIVSDKMKIYQFAISANCYNTLKTSDTSTYQLTSSSSGMVWESCTVLHSKIIGNIKNVWVNTIGLTSMELRWNLCCSDRIGEILGFRIFYCPVVSTNNSTCKEPMLNKTVSGEMAQDNQGISSISDLKSYTTYKVTIASITRHGEGLHSDPLLKTTLEEGPGRISQPNMLFYKNSSRIAVFWPRPVNSAGPIDYYELIVAHNSRPKKSRITYHGSSSPTDIQIQENPNNFLYHTNSNMFCVPVPVCTNEQSSGNTFSFAVRAVNNNPLDPHSPYYGQWSVCASISCMFPST
ncbi:hypothetical protein ACI65C_004582 [Semiaphis heraclei]